MTGTLRWVVRTDFVGAEGGSRTRTGVAAQRILSPLCLPFHHPGKSVTALDFHRSVELRLLALLGELWDPISLKAFKRAFNVFWR